MRRIGWTAMVPADYPDQRRELVEDLSLIPDDVGGGVVVPHGDHGDERDFRAESPGADTLAPEEWSRVEEAR